MQRTVTFSDLGASGKWSADALVGVKPTCPVCGSHDTEQDLLVKSRRFCNKCQKTYCMAQAPKGTFPGEGLTGFKFKYEATGEFRAPKKGEYYLSGAEIVAYRAPNDFDQERMKFWIAAPAKPRPVSVCSLCSQPWSEDHVCPKVKNA